MDCEDDTVRRSSRRRQAPTSKFQDMELTLRPKKSKHDKDTPYASNKAATPRKRNKVSKCTSDNNEYFTSESNTLIESPNKKKKRGKRSGHSLWLNRPKRHNQAKCTEQDGAEGTHSVKVLDELQIKNNTQVVCTYEDSQAVYAGNTEVFQEDIRETAALKEDIIMNESPIITSLNADFVCPSTEAIESVVYNTSGITSTNSIINPEEKEILSDKNETTPGNDEESTFSQLTPVIITPEDYTNDLQDTERCEESPKEGVQSNLPDLTTASSMITKNGPVITIRTQNQLQPADSVPETKSRPDHIIKLDTVQEDTPVLLPQSSASQQTSHTVVLSVDSAGNILNSAMLSQMTGVLSEGNVELMLVDTSEVPEVPHMQVTATEASSNQTSLDNKNNGRGLHRFDIKQSEDMLELNRLREDGIYKCKLCDYSTDKRANFYKHRASHLGVRRHACSKCSYEAVTSSNLRRHMLIHEGVKTHKCDLCEMSFRQKIHLIRHMEYKHMEKTVKCPHCDYTCANANPGLVLHIKRKHSKTDNDSVEYCPQCNFGPVNKKDLRQHMKFHKSGPEMKFFCEHCSFVTECKSRLTRHMMVHTKEKPYACGECSYQATQKEHVVRHIQGKHGSNAVVVNDTRVRRQKSSDSQEGTSKRLYKRTDFCTQEKHFACNFCTMKFTKLINLYKHVHLQHKDIYPADTSQFACVVCNYTTTSRKNLLVHMRKHSYPVERVNQVVKYAFSCVLCDFSSESRSSVYDHMKTEHKMRLVTDQSVKEGVNLHIPEDIENDTGGSEGTESGDETCQSEASTCEGSSNITKTVLVQLAPGGPLTSVKIATPNTSETVLQDYVTELDEAIATQDIITEVVTTDNVSHDITIQSASEQDEKHEENITGNWNSGDCVQINGEIYTVEVNDS